MKPKSLLFRSLDIGYGVSEPYIPLSLECALTVSPPRGRMQDSQANTICTVQTAYLLALSFATLHSAVLGDCAVLVPCWTVKTASYSPSSSD
ncbi:hypothetical protein B0H12DRAFT_1097172 [Mycena haematopus]|nr:hypothetical protein B0H12DRAFT_1097172 [Mycena haematopus]